MKNRGKTFNKAEMNLITFCVVLQFAWVSFQPSLNFSSFFFHQLKTSEQKSAEERKENLHSFSKLVILLNSRLFIVQMAIDDREWGEEKEWKICKFDSFFSVFFLLFFPTNSQKKKRFEHEIINIFILSAENCLDRIISVECFSSLLFYFYSL